MIWATLVIQLFIQGAEPIRAEVPVASLDECFELAKDVMRVREYKGTPIFAVAAGCHIVITDKPT